MSDDVLRIEHVLQPALLCRNLERTLDLLHAFLGLYPSERADLKGVGVRNAVYPLGDFTFLELIEPYDPACAAMRLLDRHGPGWHMVTLDLAPADPGAVDRALADRGLRVGLRNASEEVTGEWHLDPRGTGGILVCLAMRSRPDENRAYAGPSWREYVGTNTRVVRSVLGVSVVTADVQRSRRVWEALGVRFESRFEDEGDYVLQAPLARGTFLQLRTPLADEAPSGPCLALRGPGLFHLALATSSLERAADAIDRIGARALREGSSDPRSLWTDPDTTFGIPIEFREA